MKRRLLFLLAALVIITILRETGLLKLSLYNSSINTSSRSTWSNDKMYYGNDRDTASRDCMPTDISQISITIWGADGLTLRDTSACDELHFDIRNTNHGLFWLPLYKNFSFSANITCHDHITIDHTSTGRGYVGHRISGNIKITGQVRVIGFCSYHELKQIINKDLIKTAREAGAKQLQAL